MQLDRSSTGDTVRQSPTHLQQVIVEVVEEVTDARDEGSGRTSSGVCAVHTGGKNGCNIALLVGAAFLLALVYKMYGFF